MEMYYKEKNSCVWNLDKESLKILKFYIVFFFKKKKGKKCVIYLC